MKEVTLRATFIITDEAALLEFARGRYRSAWADDSWEPASTGETVLEAVISSNDNPCFSTYGLEIMDSSYHEVEIPDDTAAG